MKKSLIYFALLLIVFTAACSKDDNENGTPELGELHLSSPLDNSTCEGNSISVTKCEVTLFWEPTNDLESYTLKVTNLETNKVVLIKNDIKTTSYKLVLDKNVPFSWTVSSFDGSLRKINSSSVWKFYAPANESIANYAPFPADLITPIQDQIITAVDGKIALKWIGSDVDSSNLKYTVYLDKIDGKQTPVTELTNLSDSQTSVSVSSGVYYWRVKTSDGNSSSFSQTVKFTVN